MLHSLQYYACCYALLCLLHQQHRAASLTIIIDGATTNEWATRDEYKRLLEASNDLETALSQQQQQEQFDQLEYQQQEPPAPPIRNLTGRASSPQRICGDELVLTLELVCQGRYYNHEIQPQVAEPIVKTKRASRLRPYSPTSASSSSSLSPLSSISSSSSQSQQAPSLAWSSKQPQLQLSLSQQQPPIAQSDGDENYPTEGSRTGELGAPVDRAADERNRLQQIRMMQLEAQLLPAHLAIGAQQQINRQFGTDNNNDGDTIITNYNNNDNINNHYNINPLASKPRNRYNRMVLSRRIRGASEECCKRPCDLDTLKTYCAVAKL